MKILHNISSINGDYGGPLFSMKLIAEAQSKLEHDVIIITGKSFNEKDKINFDGNVKVMEINSYSKFRYMPNWLNVLKNKIGVPDIIHTYGLWNYSNYIAGKYSREYNVPHIIAPCGMLYEEALKRSSNLKNFSWYLFQKKYLNNSSCLHAKSIPELENLSKVFPDKKIKVLPNPIDIQNNNQKHRDNSYFLKNLEIDKKIIFYIGRIHSRKGLKSLILVWNKIVKLFPGWVLIIAGTGEEDYCSKLINVLKKAKNIKFFNAIKKDKIDEGDYNLILAGSLYGNEKKQLFEHSSLFISPSNFENFGMSIAEALSYQLPVIISRNTPWKNIEKNNCGWLIDNNNDDIKMTLIKALGLDHSLLKEMGKNSIKMIKGFDKISIAKKSIDIYKSIIEINKYSLINGS